MAPHRPPIAIVCAVCGSTEVSRDAWAEWSTDEQRWVLRHVFDAAICHRCEYQGHLREVPLDPGDPASVTT